MIKTFSGHQLILPVKELSSGEGSSVIDLKYSYPLLVLTSEPGAVTDFTDND